MKIILFKNRVDERLKELYKDSRFSLKLEHYKSEILSQKSSKITSSFILILRDKKLDILYQKIERFDEFEIDDFVCENRSVDIEQKEGIFVAKIKVSLFAYF